MSDRPKQPLEARAPAPRSASRGQVVVRCTAEGWEVSGVGRAGDVYPSREEAVRIARGVVGANGGELRVQALHGRSRSSYTIGHQPFGKISAVEGIVPTREAQERAREFDRERLTPAERRLAIIRAHTPRRG